MDITNYLGKLAENWKTCSENEKNLIARAFVGNKDLNEFKTLIENFCPEENFNDEIIESLKNNARKLNKNLNNMSDISNMNSYISCVKALRETMDLIQRYDWRLLYSEYKTDGKKQVSVWEQDATGNIKNHKIWDVV